MGSNDITTTGKMLYANMYATEADLPSATTYHGNVCTCSCNWQGIICTFGRLEKIIDESSSTTTDLTEGTNLYYTAARVQTKLGDVSGDIIPDTDETYDLGSSTHKFNDLFLSGSSITLGSIVLQDNSGVFETNSSRRRHNRNICDRISCCDCDFKFNRHRANTLDTLNELAAALGDDANFATTVTTSLGTKLNLSLVGL